MSRTKPLTGLCQECGEPISYLAERVGTMAQCPHCGKATELLLAPVAEDSSVPRRGMIWAAIAVVILVVGVAGPLVGLKRFQKRVADTREKKAAAAAAEAASMAAQAGFNLSPITLGMAPANTLVEVVGIVTNTANRERFGVTVEFALFDASGVRVGGAKARKDRIEAGGQWEFRAPVSGRKAVSARLASIREGQ